MPFKDLREFIAFLETKGELLRTRKPVDVKFEISSYIRKTSDVQGPALLFDNVKNFNMPGVGRSLCHPRKSLSCLRNFQRRITSISFKTLWSAGAPRSWSPTLPARK